MQTKLQKALYCDLELVTDPTSNSATHSLKTRLAEIWRFLSNAITSSDESQIWPSIDRFGQIWWTIYFPKTGQTARFSSKEEAQIWLKETFHTT